MSTLKVNFENLRSVSEKVIQQKEQFTELLGRIENQNNNLRNAWEGTDATAYTQAVAEQAQVMNKLAETINEIGIFLQKVNTEYQKAQEANKNAIG